MRSGWSAELILKPDWLANGIRDCGLIGRSEVCSPSEEYDLVVNLNKPLEDRICVAQQGGATLSMPDLTPMNRKVRGQPLKNPKREATRCIGFMTIYHWLCRMVACVLKAVPNTNKYLRKLNHSCTKCEASFGRFTHSRWDHQNWVQLSSTGTLCQC